MPLLSSLEFALVPGAFVVLVLATVLVLLVPWPKMPLGSFAASAIALVYLVFTLVPRDLRWGWAVALLPPALVIQHAAYLSLFRARFLPAEDDRFETAFADAPDHLRTALRSAWLANKRFFGAPALILRYWVPALLLGIAGIAVLYTLFVEAAFESLSFAKSPKISVFCAAARYGAAGAYAYVLMYLGRRTFQQDITSGAVNWSAVTLALGPLVAGLLALVTSGDAMKWGAGSLTTGGLYFVAGFSPNYVVAAVRAVVEKAWPGEKKDVEDRTVSLLQIRGIDASIAGRLAEEGIQDATALAMCDPHRLLRNTPFPKRLILCWMDEALLLWAFPEKWKEIESLGITGAIDLAWCAQSLSAKGSPPDPFLATLSEKTGLSAEALAGALQRLFEDAQVQLAWALYQLESSEVGSQLAAPPAPAEALVAVPSPERAGVHHEPRH